MQGGDILRKLAAIWLDNTVEMFTEDDRDKTKRVVYTFVRAGKNRLSEILSYHRQLLHEVLLPEVIQPEGDYHGREAWVPDLPAVPQRISPQPQV